VVKSLFVPSRVFLANPIPNFRCPLTSVLWPLADGKEVPSANPHRHPRAAPA